MSKFSLCSVALVLVFVWQANNPLSVHAYKPSQFPGKGDYSAWRRAQTIYKSAVNLCIKGKNEDAIRLSQEAIACYPYDGSFWQNIGIAYIQMKQPKQAEDALRKSIALNPDDYASWNSLANSLDDQNRLEEEREAYRQALACKYPPPQDMRNEIVGAIKSIDRDLLARKK